MDDNFSLKRIVIFSIVGLFIVLSQFILGRIITDDIFVMCDIGQGDGMYLRIDDMDIVIDAGKDKRMSQCLGRYMNFYDRTVDIVFITNSDLDHYGGLPSVMSHYKIDSVLVPPVADQDVTYFKILNNLRKKGSKIEVVKAGDSIELGTRAKVSMVWPTERIISYDDKPCALDKNKHLSDGFVVVCSNINRYSHVFWLDLKIKNNTQMSILFTGDITGEEVDNYLVSNLKKHRLGKQRTVILKVPHHGSKNGLTEKMVDAIGPDMAFISAGRRNSYGHPHASITNLLRSRSIPYYVTAKSKDIVYELNSGLIQ